MVLQPCRVHTTLQGPGVSRFLLAENAMQENSNEQSRRKRYPDRLDLARLGPRPRSTILAAFAIGGARV
jgi:hypothetical protein